jgi:hypothetical protein
MTRRADFVPPWIDRAELAQVEALARAEAGAAGFDPDAAAVEARADFVRSERLRRRREKPATDVFRETEDGTRDPAALEWLPESRRVVADLAPRRQTPGQRRRFLRNQVVLAAHMAGFSQRKLATVFDLPHSRISAIVAEMTAAAGLD